MNRKKVSCSVKQYLRMFLEHGNHRITWHLGNKTLHTCARCTGMYATMLLMLPVVLLNFFGYIHLTFNVAFCLSWILAIPSIYDWATVKLGMRDGNNKARLITGSLLGAGIITYIFLLPSSWLFRIGTFVIYELIMSAIVLSVHMHELGLSFNDIKDMARVKPNRMIYGCMPETTCCCDCCFPNCNFGFCLLLPLLCTCCTIPLCCGCPILSKAKGNKKASKAENASEGSSGSLFSRILRGI